MITGTPYRNKNLIEAIRKTHRGIRESTLRKIDRRTRRLIVVSAREYIQDCLDDGESEETAELVTIRHELSEGQVKWLQSCDCAGGSAAEEIQQDVLAKICEEFHLHQNDLEACHVQLRQSDA